MPRIRRWTPGVFCLFAVTIVARTALAVPGCPFCGPSAPPFSSRLAQCDLALLVTWESLKPSSDEEDAAEVTTFKVVKTFKAGPVEFKPGERISWIRRDGKVGDVYLLLGTKDDDRMTWSPIAITSEYLYSYIAKVPSPEAANRLAFFVKFLEFPESEIANDAYAEFSRAQFKDVAALAPQLPRTRLREWLSQDDPQSQVRLGLFGMMLGLCGDDSDAAFLERVVMKAPDPDRPRFGIDGMMAGYVMLCGEPGLQKLASVKFDDPKADGDLPLLSNALVFLWDYCQDRISPEALKGTMRRMLDRPKWAFGVVENLARWKDWKSLDALIAHYGTAPFDSTFAKTKIVEFALVCEKDGRTTSPNALPASAVKARKFLNSLDKDFVKGVERSLGGLRRTASDSKPTESQSKDK